MNIKNIIYSKHFEAHAQLSHNVMRQDESIN